MIYLATPYTHAEAAVRAQRYAAAVSLTKRLMIRYPNRLIISPITHCHPIDIWDGPQFPYQYWIKWSRALQISCSQMWVGMIPGWATSKGVRAEVELADMMAQDCLYVDADTLEFVDVPSP